MPALYLVITAIALLALAYRYYGAFMAAKVVSLQESRQTPSVRLNDGQNFFPTNRWVLFGHHFAAIAGAGPLIGPVLAAQYGFAPSFLWLVAGAIIAGGVHDFMILIASVRQDGQGLAEIAKRHISPLAGAVGSVAVLIILIVALAGLGLAVVNALKDSAWGTFTILMTIPAALLTGLWMYRLRPGKVAEASAIGVALVLLSVIGGAWVARSSAAPLFTFNGHQITLGIAAYGFIASVLPVWMLLCPRDYLSSYLKIGTIAVLVVGVFFLNPTLKMPAFTPFIHGGGPIIAGPLFPFLFITIACGAISGFHSLVGSGTTPKMIKSERDALPIGYGAMLVESLIGIVALVAACTLEPADYYAINVSADKFAAMGLQPVHLAQLSQEVGEQVAGRPGGAVSLAVGFAQIFSALPFMQSLLSYWYHFAIMFEALFILTTIDTGTRVARFMMQEFGGHFYKPLARPGWWPGTIAATGLVVFLWSYFIWTGNISTIWPMFGVANQLLACVALTVATTALLNAGKARYAWITAVPLVFITVTTLYAAWLNLTGSFWPMTRVEGKQMLGWVNSTLTVLMMGCVAVILWEAARRWVEVAKGPALPDATYGLADGREGKRA